MGNLSTQTFLANTTFTVPAGVTQVFVSAKYNYPTIVGSPRQEQVTAIDAGGNAWSWGQNQSGALGVGISPGTLAAASSPLMVIGGLQFIKVVQQDDLSLVGLTPQGQLWSWGDNGSLNLGDNTSINKSSPVLVVGGQPFIDVVGGNGYIGGFTVFSLGLTPGGDVYGWGDNNNGQLGDGTTTSRKSPVKVVGGQKFVRIWAGDSGESYAMTATGQMYAWGANLQGQLGINNINAVSSPVAVVGGLTFANFFNGKNGKTTSVASGTAYGITTAGQLYAWGVNTNGQLGIGNVTSKSSPTLVLGGLTFNQITGDSSFVIALTSTGKAYAWGNNSSGQLGLNDVTPRSSPVAVVGGLNFSQVSVNSDGSLSGNNPVTPYVLALTADGTGYGWGSNVVGQLGVGGGNDRSSPVAIVGGLKFNNIYAASGNYLSGFVQSFGISQAGDMYSWGINGAGEGGNGTVSPNNSPVKVLGGIVWKQQSSQPPVVISVIPGQTYTVGVNQPCPSFGAIQIGYGIPTSVTVSFEQ